MDAFKTTRPFVYVILPLILILVCGSLALTYHMRRRRYRLEAAGAWPGVPLSEANAILVRDRSRRVRDWSAPPLEEGLNELGEAPPPYVQKKDAPGTGTGTETETGTGTGTGTGTETEEASRPPEYARPTQPPRAVVRNAF